jgi:hypothetical protein
MAATFQDWLLWPDRTVVVLAELQPTLELSGWTAVGMTAPNTYQVALPRSILSHIVTGGVTQRCAGVRQNATSLTARVDLATVDADPGSWWWDEAAEVLYVHTTTGSGPDTFTVMQAVVRLYVATKGVVLNRVDGDPDTGIYYQPWLDGVLPTIEREVEDIFFGQKLIATGNIRLLNATGVFDTLVAPDGRYHWKNKRVTFLVGGEYNGQSLLRSQYVVVTTMLVEDASADDQFATFKLKPQARRLVVDIPRTPIFETEYPHLGDGVRGTRKWFGYGRTFMRPDLTDTSGDGVYTVADAAYQTLFAVHQVWAVAKTTGRRTALTVTTDYTVDLTACTVTVVNPTYTHEDYLLEIDVTGKPDGAGSYLRTFGAIVVDLLTNLAGIPGEDIDQSAFDQCDLDAPEELSLWIKSPRTLASVISTTQEGFPSLERSVLGTVQETLAGKFTAWIWDPGFDATTVVSLKKSDFSVFKPKPKLETIASEVRINYAPNPATEEWSTQSATDPKVQFTEDTNAVMDLYTYLRQPAAAAVLAQRYQLLAGAVSTEVEFALRRPLLIEHVAGDKVLVTYDRAPSASGAYENRAFEIVKLGKSFAPTVSIVGRLGDLRGVGERIAHVTADSALDWTASSIDERVGLGYVSDDDGYVDPSDLSTLNARVIW